MSKLNSSESMNKKFVNNTRSFTSEECSIKKKKMEEACYLYTYVCFRYISQCNVLNLKGYEKIFFSSFFDNGYRKKGQERKNWKNAQNFNCIAEKKHKYISLIILNIFL